MSEKNINSLLCNPISGICELPSDADQEEQINEVAAKHVSIIYFTDPICSTCWGIEPQLKKLKLEYGHELQFEYRMGGLLPDWSYNSGGISKPSDVAAHWDEVSQYYHMPIDGDVWITDPLDSSYPPSIAFKAAELQDIEKAQKFLRIMREMVFVSKMNIAKWENIQSAAAASGLDTHRLKINFDGQARALFQEDLLLAKSMGVRGFPTIFISGPNGSTEKIYGFKPYPVFEEALAKIAPNIVKQSYEKSWEALFSKFSSLTLREFSELTDSDFPAAQAVLDRLVEEGKLSVLVTKNGNIWSR
ncbi:DsbA family protein [Pedobacter rhizosphaerae]|uniref:Predicted dithiol-disulfide isomerase, DsbA family n=1 Tax=Pedobacter rhizosphaerae TaxID=390241 RepID=A0A1H9SGC5_9SPHI|nr:DsbA family protein [Pedobacter rhizosphaerae]SER84027.1 Predicted dithiol-disulfide isomerase, DsbA family [Pedobacter rhizosphaerae]